MSKPATFEKGLRQLAILVGLLIFSPIVLSLGFKAQRVYTESPQIIITYLLLFIGVSLVLFTVYFGFKTFKTFLDALFKK